MSAARTLWEFVDATASAVAAKWLKLHALDPHACLYLYYLRADGLFWGELTVASSAPEGYDLACQTRISPAWDIAQVRGFVHDALIALPVIGTSPAPLLRSEADGARAAARANAA